MHIRPARREDASDIATIMAKCNETDALARYLTRDIFKYYTSYRNRCLRYNKSKMIEKGNVTFVVETDPEDLLNRTTSPSPPAFGYGSDIKEGRLVVGYAIWSPIGTSERARKWQSETNSDWGSMIEKGLNGIEEWYSKLFPAVDQSFNHDHMKKVIKLDKNSWDAEIFQEAWELALLCVHPDWQRRGVAGMLLKFGFERAQKDKVPVVIKGSPVGSVVYKRAGFKSVEYLNFNELFDELEYGGERMQGWVWEPEISDEDGNDQKSTILSGSRWIDRARVKNKWMDLSKE